MAEHATIGGTAFGLEPGHLGRNRIREVYLHVRVSRTLDRIGRDVPGCIVDVLDGDGNRIREPTPTAAFVEAVEMFDVPGEAPHRVVVYGPDAAASFSAAFPEMACRTYDGPGDDIVFELEREQLGRDRFGLIHLSDDLRRAIDIVQGDARMFPCQVFDGEGLPVKPARAGASEPASDFAAEPVSILNGFEPRYVAFHDRRAAERFGRLFPAMRRDRLADLERIWRQARKE